MSAKFILTAEARAGKGTGASRRLRRLGKIPAVLYGAGKDPMMLELEHDSTAHHIKNEAFFTSILTIKVGGQTDQAILRDIQMHPYKPRIQHMDLQRISATEKLHIAVPLHFLGGDIAPGVKQQGGVVSHLLTEVDVSCLPHQLPEYLEVDLSNLSLGQSVHLSNIKLPEGVTITSLAHGNDLAVAAISIVRAVVEAEVAAVVAAPVEGEAAAAAEETEPAEGAKAEVAAAPKTAAPKAAAPKKEGKKEKE
ncbi:MAG TPA: 50S ribosomal protein L25/general stress protein Ctc [Acidiferrobacterales bacterium]|nr:50S ribosomal protein L25/general stress protein Ctc [Acidiferrobacterales bacterium]